MRLRKAARQDTNHGEIAHALELRGVRVVNLARLGRGVPDLLCGFGQLTALMEVKMPQPTFARGTTKGGKRGEKRVLTPDQLDPHHGFTEDERYFHATWPGQPIFTVRTIAEALAVFGLEPA